MMLSSIVLYLVLSADNEEERDCGSGVGMSLWEGIKDFRCITGRGRKYVVGGWFCYGEDSGCDSP